MKKTEIDYWITRMLDSFGNVSDLNMTVGKPLQVESSGKLVSVPVEPPITHLSPFQAEVFALNLIGRDQRLLKDLVTTGSCDLSYWLGNRARFRVNIFKQKNNLSTVLRKLETTIPTIDGLGLPPIFNKMAEEKKRSDPCHRCNRFREVHYPRGDSRQNKPGKVGPHSYSGRPRRVRAPPQRSDFQST